MATWLGESGSITDASKYASGMFYETDIIKGFPQNVIASVINTILPMVGQPATLGDLIFGAGPVPTVSGPTGQPIDSDSNQPGSIPVPYLRQTFYVLPPPAAPVAHLIGASTGYTVSGSATVNSIYASASDPVSFTGNITANMDTAFLGPITLSGNLTELTKATLAGVTVSGTSTFKGMVDPTYGQISLLIQATTTTITSSGKVTTAGLYVDLPVIGEAASNYTPTLNILGSLTDTDSTIGIQIAAADNRKATVHVQNGQVKSVTVTDGAMGGQGTIDVASGGEWTNTRTLAVGQAGKLTIEAGGDVKTGGLTLNGMATVTGGKLEGSDPSGVFLVAKTGMLTVSAQGMLNTPALETLTGSTTKLTGAMLTNSGVASSGGSAAMLDGTVDWIGSTVDETASQGVITAGFDNGDAGDGGTVTAKNSTVMAASTMVGAGSPGGSVAGSLTITGGNWSDTGSGTTMTVGAGGMAFLHATGGASLNDQDVSIGAVAGAPLSVAELDNGVVWTIKGALTDGGAGQGSLSIGSGSTVAVAAMVTIAAPSDGQSTIEVDQGTLTAGSSINIGGSGSGAAELRVVGGTVTAASGTVELASGGLDIGGQGAVLQAQGLKIDASSTVVPNVATITTDGDVQLSGTGVTVGAGSTLNVKGGTLEAAAVTVAEDGLLKGYGTLKGVGGADTSVDLGGTSVVAEGGTLEIDGALTDGNVTINNDATLKVTGALTVGQVTFYGNSRLVLGKSDPSAAIAGFGMGDAIDITRSADTATVNDDVLTISSGGTYVESFKLVGNYAGAVFSVLNTGGGFGSEITLASGPPPTPGVKAPGLTPPVLFSPGGGSAFGLGSISDANASSLTVTVDDANGLLGATASGGATLAGGGTRLAVSGTVADVNATLATLIYQATVPGVDTLTVDVTDNLGAADAASTSVTVPDTGLSATVPGALSVIAGLAAPVAGVTVADPFADPGATLTATLSAAGALTATAAGAASVAGGGTGLLTITGDVTSLNRTLATLTYTGTAGASADTLVLAVADPYGGSLTQLVALGIAQPVAATETDWANDDDGDAGDPASWTSGLPTPALLTVLTPGAYTVSGDIDAGKVSVLGSPTFTGTVSAVGAAADDQTFVVDDGGIDQGGIATFDGGTLDTASLVVGTVGNGMASFVDGAQATLTGMGPDGAAESAYLGFASGASGALDVTGAAVSAATGLSIGADGIGTLGISGGGSVVTGTAGGTYAANVLGDAADGAGAIGVTGTGSFLETGGQLFLGVDGVGSLALADGATAVSDGPAGGVAAYAGYDATGIGSVSVDGTGTVWDVTQNLVLGLDGLAEVEVTDGGTLEVDGSLLRVGRNAGSIAVVQVYGPGATIDAPDAELSLGLDGSASLTLGGGGQAILGSVVIGGNADATATLEVDAGSLLSVAGTFSDGAAFGTVITVSGGTIATGGGLDIGNGTQTVLNVQSGGTVEGGIGLGAGATLVADQTATLDGTLTLTGGTFAFADLTPGAAGTLAMPVIVSGPAQGSITTITPLTITGGITFDLAGGADLLLGGGVTLASPVSGFQLGDTLDLQNLGGNTVSGDVATWSDGVLSLTAQQFEAGASIESFDLPGDFATTQFVATPDASGEGVDVTIACYARGTRIAVPGGEVPVESLRAGSLVMTASRQLRAVRWLGRRRYSARGLAANAALRPVRFAAGSLGGGLPRRDLLVSPEHAMLLGGVLVPARCLTNGDSIRVAQDLPGIEYFHVELATHDVILAEGAASETFVDDGSRAKFDNYAEWAADRTGVPGGDAVYCAPRVNGGYTLEAVRRRIAAVGAPVRVAA